MYHVFVVLLNLLRNDDLMVKRLNLRSTNEFDRMTEICRLVGKPVAENPRQISSLADKLDYFLEEHVKKKQWDQNEVKDLVEDPNNRQDIIQLINDYGMVTGKNLFEEASKLRNKGIR
jgi:hypothetical protein